MTMRMRLVDFASVDFHGLCDAGETSVGGTGPETRNWITPDYGVML